MREVHNHTMQTANFQANNAIRRSDVYLKLMMIKRIVGVLILACAVFVFRMFSLS